MGLLPFSLFFAALLALSLAGYQCGILPVNEWIWVAGLFWIGELLLGTFYALRQQTRRFAVGLIVTLPISVPLSIPLIFLAGWFVAHGVHPFCTVRS